MFAGLIPDSNDSMIWRCSVDLEPENSLLELDGKIDIMNMSEKFINQIKSNKLFFPTYLGSSVSQSEIVLLMVSWK